VSSDRTATRAQGAIAILRRPRIAGAIPEHLRGLAALDPQAVRSSRRELLLASVLLAVLCGAVYGAYAARGGFLIDDWYLTRVTLMPDVHGDFGGVRQLFETFGFRPLFTVWTPAVYWVLSDNQTAHLIQSLLLALALACALYALLRRVRLAPVHAFAIAALCLIYPFADSIRFWSAASYASLTLALFVVGLTVAIRALSLEGRRALWLHGLSLALFAASVLLYELAAPFIFLTVFVYLLGTTRRRAITRAGIDAALGAALLVGVTLRNRSDWNSTLGADTGAHAMWEHAKLIYSQAATILARTLEPWADPSRIAVLAVAGSIAVWGVVALFRRPDAVTRRRLRLWLGLAGAGLAIGIVGYVVYIPGPAFQYFPLGGGVYNRINGVAGIGFVLLGYGLVATAVILAPRALPSSRGAVLIAGVLLLGATGIGYAVTVIRHSDAWIRSSRIQHGILDFVQSRLPHPAPGTTVYVRAPVFTGQGISVFAADWEITLALQLRYHRKDIAGYPVLPGMVLVCGANGVSPGNTQPGWYNGQTAYGKVYVLTPRDNTMVWINSPEVCRQHADLQGFWL